MGHKTNHSTYPNRVIYLTLSNRLGLPFIYSEHSPRERLEALEKNQQVIMSSIGDEGISCKNLQRVIEFDWHGGRAEAAQRVGRLHHSQEQEPEYIMLMTDEEYVTDEKRLYALYEKGYHISVVR